MNKITQESFEHHIKTNPDMWNLFLDYKIHHDKLGRNYSAGALFHFMRVDTDIRDSDSKFKVDQRYSSWYARKFNAEFPQYTPFKTKEMKCD